jgi:hypothetical protein
MASGSSGFKSINDARKRGITSASRRKPVRLTKEELAAVPS